MRQPNVDRSRAQNAHGAAIVATLALALSGAAAHAETADEALQSPAVVYTLDYTLDLAGVAQGGLARRGGHLDALSLAADIDLERAVGWRGASAHIEASNTAGGAPGEHAGTLQGVDNIEVGARRPRLYQAWIEQAFAGERGNLRLGFSDLSGEFAVADSSGLLLNPSFGMAAEFAASGAAAFPSTSMGARLRLHPTLDTYVQVAVANARAASPGDAGGADFSFDDGEILLAEAGWTGRGKLAAGYWRLSERQDDLIAVDAAGDPARQTAEGAYLVIEQPIIDRGDGGRSVMGFLRAGASDGRTTEFKASWQAGVLVEPAFAARPDSAFSFGVTQARLSDALRQAAAAGGQDLARDETIFEAAYSDLVTPWLRVQPDVQYVRRPSGDRGVEDALVVALRFNVAF